VSPEAVDQLVAIAVTNVLDSGAMPARVFVGVPAYRALVERDGLAPRSIGKTAATSLRALVLGFDLPVDCERSVTDDNAVCTYVPMTLGRD
jgi:hypothetical protein